MADSGRKTSSGTQSGQILASEVMPRRKTEFRGAKNRNGNGGGGKGVRGDGKRMWKWAEAD